MNTSPSTSVFFSLGYNVLSLELGVYVLGRQDESNERCVALLLALEKPTSPTIPVQLFMESVPADVASSDITGVWQELNARRFESTGLVAADVELGPFSLDEIHVEHLPRPGGGTRTVLCLPTGDMICLN